LSLAHALVGADGRMDPREELNATTDEVLHARVDAVVAAGDSGDWAAHWRPDKRPDRLAPFITFHLLHRVRERIVHHVNSGACRLGLLKTLALVACDLTGAIPDTDLADVEKLSQR
jgi:hypothetical protein